MIDLNPNHLGTVKAILAEHVPECEVRAFGSRATWTAKDYSDLDLAILGQGPLDWTALGRLEEAFEESDLPMRVDVLDWHAISGSFREMIEREHVVLVDNPARDSTTKDWLYHPRLPSHWKRKPLYAMAQWVNGLAFRKIQFSSTGKPIIKIAELKGGISGQTKFTDQTFDDSVRVRPGDLLFSWSGQPETSIDAFWWRGPEGWLNQHVFRVTPNNGVDTTFFYYLLRYLRPNFVNIARNKQTTGLGHVTKRDLENIEAATPNLPEQRTIAQVLGSFDDKIELNRQLNETLEGLVRAIFKDWFVDFGPVRAKLEGRDTGLPEQLAELFPDRLVESELGGIPEGWEVRPVTALVSIVGGGTPKTSVDEYWGGDIPWFSVVDTPPPGSVYVVMTEKTITQKGLQESSARLVPEGTTIISARGTVGNLAMCGRPMAFNQSCYGLRPSSDVGDYFVFLTAHNLVDRLQAMAHGSVFSTITRQTIEAVSVAVAPRAVHLAFEATVRPFFSKIKVNVEEARILAQVRDVLLPRLVSGEVRADVETL